MIKDVTDLEVYTSSLNLLEQVYKFSNNVPYDHKRLKLQLIGAAEGIAPQIAEGFGKKKFPKEFCRFLAMALGSSDEVITHFREIEILSKNHPSLNSDEIETFIQNYKILSKRLNKLLTTWQKFSR